MGWTRGIAEWVVGETAHISVPFTWKLQEAYQRACWYRQGGYYVRVGGPAVKLMPEIFHDVGDLDGDVDALPHHNPLATFTSRGCIRRCSFCAVPKIEGDLIELDTWPIRPIVCDNNLLACSKAHFDKVIDSLKPLQGIDFNQGLDARLLTQYHANRLAELDCTVRLAWDHINLGNQFMAAYEKLRKAGISKSRVRCYVLIGFNDTPDDAWFRLRTLRNLGIKTSPMRYNPLDAIVRDSYVSPNWTDKELKRFMWYWANHEHVGGVPFDEWEMSHKESTHTDEVQFEGFEPNPNLEVRKE